MHRLFVAIRPPRLLREALLARMGGIANARWQTDEQLHLTLRFIGEVDRHQAEDIAAALGQVHHPAFTLALDRVGRFDRKGRIDTLWVGAGPAETLQALHNKIDRALVRIGLPPETRAYLPHITIARFGRTAGGIDAFVETASPPALSADVTEYCLYESTLGHEGSHYAIIARYPLG